MTNRFNLLFAITNTKRRYALLISLLLVYYYTTRCYFLRFSPYSRPLAQPQTETARQYQHEDTGYFQCSDIKVGLLCIETDERGGTGEASAYCDVCVNVMSVCVNDAIRPLSVLPIRKVDLRGPPASLHGHNAVQIISYDFSYWLITGMRTVDESGMEKVLFITRGLPTLRERTNYYLFVLTNLLTH